jgi:predicted O-methyltransferase YrrM
VAFLEACKAGKVAEVHLCDPVISEELERLVGTYNLGDRVQIRPMRSVDLLRERAPYDFVFVDGDHSAENVKLETELLLEQKTPCVMAHDVSVAPLYPLCDGPQHLQSVFQASGYLCAVESILRQAEQTERGMLLAARTKPLYDIGLAALRSIL